MAQGEEAEWAAAARRVRTQCPGAGPVARWHKRRISSNGSRNWSLATAAHAAGPPPLGDDSRGASAHSCSFCDGVKCGWQRFSQSNDAGVFPTAPCSSGKSRMIRRTVAVILV